MSTPPTPPTTPAGWPTQLDASFLPSTPNAAELPEVAGAEGPANPPFSLQQGICISGGGSRSLSAAMGQLRGLAASGELANYAWLSTVSGGTWAGTLWCWADAAISDETLLGPYVPDPAALRWDSGPPGVNLGLLDPHAIGSAATRIGITEMLEKAIELYWQGVPVAELWPRAIGELVLAPFGLGDSPQKYFTWTPWWRDNAVLKYNPKLTKSDFVTTRPNRPYLVTNSTLFYPPSPPSGIARAHAHPALATAWEVGYEVESTPIGVGIPPAFPNAGAPAPGQPTSADLGGGWIDAFAMGSIAPQKITPDRRFQVPTPPNRFRLSDLAGLSSLAFAYDVIAEAHKTGIHFLDDMIPAVTYWPVYRANQQPRNAARPYLFGDGGNLENQGIMPLLRRGMKKILAFVNTETKLSRASNLQIVVDSDLPPLFGLEWSSSKLQYVPISPSNPMRFNQVFDSKTFDDLRAQLWNGFASGNPAVAKQTNVKVYANPHYGVRDSVVDLEWRYLSPVANWIAKLDPSVQKKIRDDWWNFGNFPNYSTVDQLHLDARQVNLLASLTGQVSYRSPSAHPVVKQFERNG